MQCSNCRATNAVAWNDNFCNCCEHEWYRVVNLTFRPSYKGDNPEQAWVDEIFYGVTNGENITSQVKLDCI